MEFNQSVSNPMLVGCFELLKAEDTIEHREMFIGELQNAKLLSPALIEPAPEEDSEGNLKLLPGSKIQFPMLSAPDGKQFFMGFTDNMEYQKWVEQNQAFPTFALKFDDYVGMMLNKDAQGNPCPAMGFVINPCGTNIVVPRETIAEIMGARLRQAAQTKAPGTSRKLHMPPVPNAAAAAESPAGDPEDGSGEK